LDGYYWIRVFDFDFERDCYDKGILLDEFYLKDISGGREEVKAAVKARYGGKTHNEIMFAKPKKKGVGIYAIVMDSDKFFYDRFYDTIDTFCFWCHKPIKGKASEFPREFVIGDDFEGSVHFCNWETCKSAYRSSLNDEGEFQVKEAGGNGDIFGYIYLIYNRVEDIHYIGQTRFMPFFRWQEHIKSGEKGDIKDLTFSVVTEVPRCNKKSTEENQLMLNSIEAWWISKFQEEGFKVLNLTRPKITVEHLKQRFDEMVSRQPSIVF
jgi:hypothetical protein